MADPISVVVTRGGVVEATHRVHAVAVRDGSVIASAGDALFSLLPQEWWGLRIYAEAALILTLIVLNLRGVKESVQILLPIFLLFLVTHLVLIVGP